MNLKIIFSKKIFFLLIVVIVGPVAVRAQGQGRGAQPEASNGQQEEAAPEVETEAPVE